MTNPIDNLRRGRKSADSEDTTPADSEDTTPDHATGTVLIDYRGRTGREGEFEHTGSTHRLDRGEVFRLMPGLNVVAAEVWARYESTTDASDVTVAVDLSRWNARAARLDLAKRTLSADALDMLLAAEKARSHSGPDKQDPRILDLLTKRAQAAAQSPEPDLSGVLSLAGSQSNILHAGMQARRDQASRMIHG